MIDSVRDFLKNFGLTEKEIQVYTFLAKNKQMKGSVLARSLKMQKGQVYTNLKSLQRKGFIETTLESPAQFSAVPFDKVIDLFIKATKESAVRIETSKQELIKDWQKIAPKNIDEKFEKFTVIDSEKSIPKSLQMVADAEKDLCIISSIQEIIRAKRLGLFSLVLDHPEKKAIHFRIITKISDQNIGLAKSILKDAEMGHLQLGLKTVQSGSQLPANMFVRDEEEVLFYIKQGDSQNSKENNSAFWTNSKSLVQVFKRSFEDAWKESIEITKTADNLLKETLETFMVRDLEDYLENALNRTHEKIITVMSPSHFVLSRQRIDQFKELAAKGISIKIMVPITNENIDVAKELENCCSIKHVSTGHQEAIVVDGLHLYQIKEDKNGNEHFFYSCIAETVNKAEIVLDKLWGKSQQPSQLTLKAINQAVTEIAEKGNSTLKRALEKIDINAMKSYDSSAFKTNEKEIIRIILDAANEPCDKEGNIKQYGSAGQAIIHPPTRMNLPDLLFYFLHNNKQSTHGAQDAMIICVWIETPHGKSFMPSTVVYDNAKVKNLWQNLWAGSPMRNNLILVEKNQLKVEPTGNSLFIGWTIPINLYPLSILLPPACILLEGYGRIKSYKDSMAYPSGYWNCHENNSLEAFVTFYHPASKYSGPGTDGIFARESVMTIYPPANQK